MKKNSIFFNQQSKWHHHERIQPLDVLSNLLSNHQLPKLTPNSPEESAMIADMEFIQEKISENLQKILNSLFLVIQNNQEQSALALKMLKKITILTFTQEKSVIDSILLMKPLLQAFFSFINMGNTSHADQCTIIFMDTAYDCSLNTLKEMIAVLIDNYWKIQGEQISQQPTTNILNIKKSKSIVEFINSILGHIERKLLKIKISEAHQKTDFLSERIDAVVLHELVVERMCTSSIALLSSYISAYPISFSVRLEYYLKIILQLLITQNLQLTRDCVICLGCLMRKLPVIMEKHLQEVMVILFDVIKSKVSIKVKKEVIMTISDILMQGNGKEYFKEIVEICCDAFQFILHNLTYQKQGNLNGQAIQLIQAIVTLENAMLFCFGQQKCAPSSLLLHLPDLANFLYKICLTSSIHIPETLMSESCQLLLDYTLMFSPQIKEISDLMAHEKTIEMMAKLERYHPKEVLQTLTLWKNIKKNK